MLSVVVPSRQNSVKLVKPVCGVTDTVVPVLTFGLVVMAGMEEVGVGNNVVLVVMEESAWVNVTPGCAVVVVVVVVLVVTKIVVIVVTLVLEFIVLLALVMEVMLVVMVVVVLVL